MLNGNSDRYSQMMSVPAPPLLTCAINVGIDWHAQMVVQKISALAITKVQIGFAQGTRSVATRELRV